MSSLPIPAYAFLDFCSPVLFQEVTEAASCARGWLTSQGNCYAYFDTKKTWSEAEIECQSYGRGTHLASVLSKAETELLAEHIASKQREKSHVWIGLRDPSQVSLSLALFSAQKFLSLTVETLLAMKESYKFVMITKKKPREVYLTDIMKPNPDITWFLLISGDVFSHQEGLCFGEDRGEMGPTAIALAFNLRMEKKNKSVLHCHISPAGLLTSQKRVGEEDSKKAKGEVDEETHLLVDLREEKAR
ncbi:hypothetical protein JD844_001223 [Phrynosoma platyrhinos]|uniref:C-type lectin domain-containing protein n=1 Tax=Phrynosoma platyrhinos TaxID=52577 RepID=A0ABQ7T9B4_PHRPL|nr:hypothetical protein JD844_001223 [Phrynosoma platyrhinos]